MPDFKPFEQIAGDASKGIVLIADHAGRAIPEPHGTLGLSATDMERHIAYDIGVEALTRALSSLLGAPAILARFSRLYIDANRNLDDPTLIRQIYDRSIIPGNLNMTVGQHDERIGMCFRPYHDAIRSEIDAVWQTSGKPPLIISMHSFTPQLKGGALRPWHIGLLSDADRRATDMLLALLKSEPDLIIGDNEPYDGALKGDTLYEQASRRGLAHTLIEVRQDLIDNDTKANEWAMRLAPHLAALAAQTSLRTVKHFGSRAGGLPIDPRD
jgi:predicted N-formylglutamate amidohydrolase